jgi:hypothetical protein
MHSLADALNIYSNVLEKLEFCKTKHKVQVLFFPKTLVEASEKLKHVRHLLQVEKLWEMDITRLSQKDYGIRVVFNEEDFLEAMSEAKDRRIQMSLLQDVLKTMISIWPESSLEAIQQALEEEKSKKPRFRTMKMEKRVSFPEVAKTLLPEAREFKLADKTVANFAHQLEIFPGTYDGRDAKEKIDSLIEKIVSEIDDRVVKYDLEKSLPLLLGKTDALVAEHDREEVMAKISLEHEVDYERASRSSENEKMFLGFYKSYRYLVEKFVQLQGSADRGVPEREFVEIVALVDRLLDVRSVSDFLHYGIYPSKVTINDDFTVSIDYGSGLDEIQDAFGEEQAKLKLGEIGIDGDAADVQIPNEDYFSDLDAAFLKDFGFGYRDLVNVQQVLALWAGYKEDTEEDVYYSATEVEIADVCGEGITDFDKSKVKGIVEFLELNPGNILRIEGQKDLAKDLPIWEYNKRLTRYSIRPIIKIGNKYYWGPHSADRASKVWLNATTHHRLPADIPQATESSSVLLKGHRSVEKALVRKAKEIVGRFTPHVQSEVHPHKIDAGIGDNRYGDYDVLAYLEDKNILLNIESKVIDPDYSLKDLQSTLGISAQIVHRFRRKLSTHSAVNRPLIAA